MNRFMGYVHRWSYLLNRDVFMVVLDVVIFVVFVVIVFFYVNMVINVLIALIYE